MNKKALIIALIITVLASIFAFTALKKSSNEFKSSEIGSLFFEKTYTQAMDINKIIIKNNNYQATMILKDDYWHITEADDYFGGLIIINSLLLSMNNSVIEAIDYKITPEMNLNFPENKETPNSGYLIETFNKNNAKVDSVIIGSHKNDFQYARRVESDIPVLISGNFELPQKLYSWLQQPLFQIRSDSVETVILQSEKNKQLAFRVEENGPFYNSQEKITNVKDFLEEFAKFTFIDVKNYETSSLKNDNPQRVAVIFLDSGLIYGIELYENQGNYWVRTNLSSNSLPTQAASDYIKDNTFLFKNWIFKISPELGEFILNYNIQ